jgi:aspartyl aminopeptidase
MKLTKQRLIEIIKEEYQSILNESKTVRLSGGIDLIFQDRNSAQIIGRKGKITLDRQDAKTIVYAVQNELSIW